METDRFQQFDFNGKLCAAKLHFHALATKQHNRVPLTNLEKEALSKIIGFPKRWLENETLTSPQLRKVIQECLAFPESSYIGLCWNRILIQNFSTNNFFVFYPPEKESIFRSPAFLAGFRNTIWGSFPKYSSMLIHGASVIIKDKAALFLAPDEGGKTTTVSHFDKEYILNDDHVVLSRENNIFFIHATPFGTISCGNKSAQLGGIFKIHKSVSSRIRKADPKKILEFIWNEHMINSIIIPKKMRVDLFNLLCKVINQIPVYDLYIKKGTIDQEAIFHSLRI